MQSIRKIYDLYNEYSIENIVRNRILEIYGFYQKNEKNEKYYKNIIL